MFQCDYYDNIIKIIPFITKFAIFGISIFNSISVDYRRPVFTFEKLSYFLKILPTPVVHIIGCHVCRSVSRDPQRRFIRQDNATWRLIFSVGSRAHKETHGLVLKFFPHKRVSFCLVGDMLIFSNLYISTQTISMEGKSDTIQRFGSDVCSHEVGRKVNWNYFRIFDFIPYR